jgi:GR25 family glycosyltransferase involved in LPS biosynthesis
MKEIKFIKKMLQNYNVKISNIKNTGNILNNYSKMIYVINIENNVIRKKYILTIMKKYGISFKLVVVQKIKEEYYNYYCKYNNKISTGELGCGLSHLWCLKDIIINKHKNAIIFEDDIIFHKNFEAKFFSIINQQNYDFLLLGACDFHFSEINNKNISNNLYRPDIKCDKLYGAHAIYYSLEGAKYVYKNKLEEFAFFDYNFNKIFNYFSNTSFICYPNLVVTELTTSDINHNYELFSEKESLFYSKCFIHFNFNDYHFIYLNLLNSKYICKFTNYQDFICYLFQKKYGNNKTEEFKKRLDFSFFSFEDIKYITNIPLKNL